MADTTQELTPTGLTKLQPGADPGFSAPLDPNDPAAIGGAAMRGESLLPGLTAADREAQAAKASTTVNLPGGPVTVSKDGSVAPGGTVNNVTGNPTLQSLKDVSASGTTADALSKLIGDFETENKATREQILAASIASEREQALQKQIDDLGNQLKKGMLNIENRPIPLEDIGGEQERLLKNTSVILSPLTDELRRLETTRMGTLDRLSRALGFRQDEQAMQLKRAELLRQPILETEKAVRDYVLDLAKKYPDADIGLQDTAESAAQKVVKSKSYQQSQAGQKNTEIVDIGGGKKILINSDTGATIATYGADGSTAPPITKEINGQTFQWNETTATWEKPTVPTSTNTISGGDIAKLPEAKQLAGIAELQRSISNYKSLIEQFGAASGFTPGARQQLDSAKEAINLAVKNAEALGALQAPDIALVERMIPDVTREGIWSSLKGIVVPGEAKRALKTIDNVTSTYTQKASNLYNQLLSQGANPSDPYLQTLAGQAGIQSNTAPSGQSLFLNGIEYVDDGKGNYAPKAGNGRTSALQVKLPSGQTKEGGSASWRNNNPLNIKNGQFASKYGATQGSAATDGGNFAAFPSVEAGLKAARDLLRSPNYTKLSLEAAMRRWSGNGYGADVAPADLRNKTLAQMSDAELTRLIEAMTMREGWKEGKILV